MDITQKHSKQGFELVDKPTTLRPIYADLAHLVGRLPARTVLEDLEQDSSRSF